MLCLLCLDLGGSSQPSWVEASFELRRPENVYFPPAIRALNLPSNQEEAASIVADTAEEAQTQDALPPS